MTAAPEPTPQGELPKTVGKPWGHEIWFAHTDRYAGKIIVVQPGQRLSLQYHDRKDETSYLMAGRLRLWQGPSADELTEREVTPGEAWRNIAGLVHMIEALECATVLEVSTPELDDVVRLEDSYGRAVPARRKRVALSIQLPSLCCIAPNLSRQYGRPRLR